MTEETRKIEFDGSQGERLAASLELPRGEPRAYALFAHCFSCTKDIKAARELARALRALGFAVLRFDFTGLGASEGDFANTNFSSNVEDLVKAAGFLRREFEAPSLLIGHSLGGAAAIVAALDIPEVKGVATIGAPSEAAHILAHIGEQRDEIVAKGVATVSLGGRPFSIKRQFLEDLEGTKVIDAARALGKPLLIMHAPLDETVGISNATSLFVAAKHPKSFVSLDTADHLLSHTEDAIYAANVLAAWAERFLPVSTKQSGDDRSDMQVDQHHAKSMIGGARAETIPGKNLAIAMSIDGHHMVIDAGAKEGGDDLGPNPTKTLEAALAACAAMTMKMYAARKKWPLAAAQVEVTAAPGEDAHVTRRFQKAVSVEGDLDAEQRARLVEIADKCPVHRILTGEVAIETTLLPAGD